jgi:hypothetical protein
MADARQTYRAQVQEFFSDVGFILSLAWQEHKAMVVGLGVVSGNPLDPGLCR